MDKLIVAIIRHEVLEKLSSMLKKENITFMYSEVKGCIPSGHSGQLTVISQLWIVYATTIGGANEIQRKERKGEECIS